MKKLKININWNNISSITQTIVGVITLIISVFALKISIKALRTTNEQFVENTRSANEQFRVNIENSNRQFDSLIIQLGTYKEIASDQLALSNKQLILIDKMLQEYVYSGRPTITIGRIRIKDTDRIINGLFAPIIEIPINNSGKRPCHNLTTNCKVFSLNSKQIRLGENIIANNLESGHTINEIFRPKLEIKYKNDFYLYFEINYKDLSINKRFKQEYYFHYSKLRSSYEFLECTEKEKIEINSLLRDQ